LDAVEPSPLKYIRHLGGQGKHIERTLSCIRNAPRCGRFGSDRSADGTQLKALLAPYPAEEMICWPKEKSRERRTVCWRKPDSNHRYRVTRPKFEERLMSPPLDDPPPPLKCAFSVLEVKADGVHDSPSVADDISHRDIVIYIRVDRLDPGNVAGKQQTTPIGMPRGASNGEPSIVQMANNAAAEKAGAAKYRHASQRHDVNIWRAIFQPRTGSGLWSRNSIRDGEGSVNLASLDWARW
jgi:hypothetical protein